LIYFCEKLKRWQYFFFITEGEDMRWIRSNAKFNWINLNQNLD